MTFSKNLVSIKTNICIKFELEKLTNLKYPIFLSRYRKRRLIEIRVMEGKLHINCYLDVEITLKILNIENFDL